MEVGDAMKPAGCKDMTLDEVAIALQLYMDGAIVRVIAAEFGRHRGTIEKLIARAHLQRGHNFRTKGPRDYLVRRLLLSYPPEMRP